MKTIIDISRIIPSSEKIKLAETFKGIREGMACRLGNRLPAIPESRQGTDSSFTCGGKGYLRVLEQWENESLIIGRFYRDQPCPVCLTTGVNIEVFVKLLEKMNEKMQENNE